MKSLIEDTKHIVAKLRELPETKKKIIFFVVMGFATVGMVFFGIHSTKKSLESFSKSTAAIQTAFGGDQEDARQKEDATGIAANEATEPLVPEWKTYERKDYGFQLQYWSTWNISQNGTEVAQFKFWAPDDSAALGMNIRKTEETDLEAFANALYQKELVVSVTIIDVGENKAAFVETRPGSDAANMVIMLANGFAYEFPELQANTSEEAKHMLSTLKFQTPNL